jgi:hypothetical protein
MRLTLRNMLASMDEILEPAQQQEIRQKIEESEFATGIMHRIRDVTRRMRLGAPKLSGKGMGLDPNTVAMYLDNTLSSERVPDFEKVCLESDVHLAEVAACHQILALVLGEPAEVNPALRRKLYDIGQASEATEAQSAAPKVPPPLPPTVVKRGRRERPRVPDYLREPRRSRIWAVAATLLLAVLLAAAVIRALGPYDQNNPALAWLPIWQRDQVAQNDAGAPTTDEPGRAIDNQPLNAVVGEDATAGTTADAASEPLPENSVPPGTADAAAAGSAPLSDPLSTRGKTIPTDSPPPAAASGTKAPLPPEPVDAQSATKATTSEQTETTIRIPVDRDPTTTDRITPSGPSADDAAKGPDPVDAAADRSADDRGAGDAPPLRVSQPVGRFLTDPNVLLRLNRAGQWERVAQGATLKAGDQLIVLPTFRPSLTLTGGLTVQVLGETLVELTPPDEKGVPGLRVPFGRIVLMTDAQPNISVRLSLGGRDGVATFVDAGSTLAAEVRRFLPAGADPEKEPAYVAIDLYVPSGEIDWKFGENPEVKRIPSPGRLTLGTPYPYEPADARELPAWIIAEKLAGADELGSGDLNRALSEENERPVALTIRELAEHRRWELKYLAARSLALIGEFDPFIPAFNDSDQRSVWPRQIESLQAALARSPQTAAMVRAAFERQRGDEGRQLYRMLRGYSKADIQAGAAEQLVEYLDHNSLDFRVLSFYALRSVPGVPPDFAGYRPESTPAARHRAVQQWRKMIASGPLSPKGAQDRPGPAPQDQPPSDSPDESSDESATRPRSVPIWR